LVRKVMGPMSFEAQSKVFERNSVVLLRSVPMLSNHAKGAVISNLLSLLSFCKWIDNLSTCELQAK
jgi:hypothetical protein